MVAGAVLAGIAQLAFPPVAPFVALPFVLLALFVAFRQLGSVSPAQVEERLAALRAMPWERFSTVVTAAYTRQGYQVAPANHAAYDFTLTRDTRVSLLQCRRWKINQYGVTPLQALHAATGKADAYNAICLCAGNYSPQAQTFAEGKPIALVSGRELAVLVGKLK